MKIEKICQVKPCMDKVQKGITIATPGNPINVELCDIHFKDLQNGATLLVDLNKKQLYISKNDQNVKDFREDWR